MPAPAMAPHTWPAPPSTAMNRYSMPILMPKGEGFTVRWKCAKSQPEIEASSAASTKMPTLKRSVSTPIASAICDPPASERIARPLRESSSRITAKQASSAKVQVTA